MKPIEATGHLVRPDNGAEISSADDAPETQLDLHRPDLKTAVAAGELVSVRAEAPADKVQLLVVLGRALVQDTRCGSSVVNIGRESGQDLIIDDASVSRHHCQICYEHGSYLLRDLGTSNGTTLNGRPAVSEKLVPGDEIGIGRFVVIFRPTRRQISKLEYRVNTLTRTSTSSAATNYLSHNTIDGVRQAVSAERDAHLLRVGPHQADISRRFALTTDVVVLGRGPTADVPVDGLLVASRHAEIRRHDDRFLIRRRASLRRLYVNGRPVKEAPLKSRDQLRIGSSTFQFFEPAR